MARDTELRTAKSLIRRLEHQLKSKTQVTSVATADLRSLDIVAGVHTAANEGRNKPQVVDLRSTSLSSPSSSTTTTVAIDTAKEDVPLGKAPPAPTPEDDAGDAITKVQYLRNLVL